MVISDSRSKRRRLPQAWLVLVLAVGLGSALAAVQVTLSPVIAANRLNETLARIPALLEPNPDPAAGGRASSALKIEPRDVQVKKKDKTTFYKVYQVAREDHFLGWVVKAAGQGYADKIELLVGLDPGIKTITGLFILDQKETPGLGNKIITAAWRDQFAGKNAGQPLRLAKGDPGKHNAIDAISGATISSRSVTRIVNQVTRDLRGPLGTERGKPES